MASGLNEKRVAVIAIHGVGDHEPFESARAVTNLLGKLKDDGGHPRYSAFYENIIRLHVRKTVTLGRTEPLPQKHTWGPMDAIVKEITPTPRALPDSGVRSLPHLFMDGQLARAKDDCAADPYTALRTDAVREECGRKIAVSVFDMHWADLSGVGSGFTGIFYELYQLLFHLTSVGAHNIQAAIAHLSRSGKTPLPWKLFQALYLGASQSLVWPIALLNLFMLALIVPIVGVSLLYAHTSPPAAFAIVDLLATMIVSLAAAVVLMRKARLSFGLQAGVFAVILSGAAAAYGFGSGTSIDASGLLLALILAACAGGLVAYVVKAFAARRPGSGRAAIACLATWFATGAGLIAMGRVAPLWSMPYPGIVACLDGFEILFFLASIAWGIFAALYALTLASGIFVLRGTLEVHLDRAKRTRWTAILTLTLPAIAFMLITLAGWAAILKLTVPLLPGDRQTLTAGVDTCRQHSNRNSASAPVPSVCYVSIFTGETKPVRVWAFDRMRESGAGYLPILFGTVLGAMAMSAWVFGPAVWREIQPPRMTDGPASWFNDLAAALGAWLSGGFRFLHWAGYVLVAGMLLFLMTAGGLFYVYSGPMKFSDTTTSVTELLGALVVGAGAGLIGFSGRLSKLALGFRPIIRVMLDVDNWLREHPRESNPTARTCARYASLLRHIATYRDPNDGQAYESLIIVAHSQGTVITADLLRFLFAEGRDAQEQGREYDVELSRYFSGDLPIYFFTMGCPLNQLYALRFPYLYGWARTDSGQARPFEIPDILPDSTGELPGPDPQELGVFQWVNSYRSGDYVGRALWRRQNCDYSFTPASGPANEGWDPPAQIPKFVSVDEERKRVEYCIGPGAHTHYWDSTAEPIAEELDRLIVSARAKKVSQAHNGSGGSA